MAFTPVHIEHVRGPRSSRYLRPQDMIKIRKLYLEKSFKNCISACDDLLQSLPSTPVTPNYLTSPSNLTLHPVHKAFLIFHQAISHECLGIAAHKYSHNKITFLKTTKDHFKVTLDVLPQPFANEADGTYHKPRVASPNSYIFGDDDDASIYPKATIRPPRIISETPTFRVSDATRSPSEESFDSATSGTTISAVYTVPDFDKYSPRLSFANLNIQSLEETKIADPTASTLHWNVPAVQIDQFESSSSDEEDVGDQVSGWLPRSSRSLNLASHTNDTESDDDTSGRDAEQSPHASHTFGSSNIKSFHAPMARTFSHTSRLSASLSSHHMLCDELVPSPLFSKNKKLAQISAVVDGSRSNFLPRPLPRTPHAHLTHLTLLPARKTAVQTLISKFEGNLPLPETPSSYTTATPFRSVPSQAIGPTPVTHRFNMIHTAFDAGSISTHLTEYLTSRSLAQYNSNLAEFRTCLLSAHKNVIERLEAAQEIQNKHDAEKCRASTGDDEARMPKDRLASLWLLSTPGKRDRKREYERVNDVPASMSLSNTSRAKMLGRSESLRGRKKLPLRNRVEESEEKRAERIEKLRKNGFKVHKERHGWKGEEYYEGFRRRVEIDLSA